MRGGRLTFLFPLSLLLFKGDSCPGDLLAEGRGICFVVSFGASLVILVYLFILLSFLSFTPRGYVD
jgi:hypothetical protein